VLNVGQPYGGGVPDLRQQITGGPVAWLVWLRTTRTRTRAEDRKVAIDPRHRILETLRFLAGLGILGTWVVLTFTMLVVGQLMSLDEEWTGWGDVLLNPYIVLPYVVISALGAMALWALFRPGRVR